MRSARLSGEATWLICLSLACAVLAGGIWYAFPQAGPWPLLAALAPWPLRWALTGRLARRTAFDLPLGLFLFSAGVAVWAAFDRQAAWSKFWLIVGGILLFYALCQAERLTRGRVWLLALFGAGVAVYFLATNNWDAYPAKVGAFTNLGRAIQSRLPSLAGHRLHPNVAGGIMAMMVPFSGLATLWALRAARGGKRKGAGSRALALGAAGGLLAITLFGLLMSTSRGAWIALATSLLVAGLWALARRLGSDRPGLAVRLPALRRGVSQAWIFPGLLTLSLAVAIVVGLALPGGLVELLDLLPGPNTALSRVDLLRGTATLVRDYPLVGAGLGTFQMLYSTYVLLLHVGFTVHSHNLALNVAVEQGVPAVLALLWMWLLVVLALWRPRAGASSQPLPAAPNGHKSPTEPTEQARWDALGAAALSLVVLLIHGQVDDVLYGSRAVLLLFVPLAFAVPFLRREQGARSLPGQAPTYARRWLGLALPIGLGLVLLVALVWRRPTLSRVYSNLGAIHQEQAELGIYVWPDWPLQDAVRRAVDLSRPIGEFQQALALDPSNATANRRLGMIELSLGQYTDALQHLQAAYAVEPRSTTTRQLLGEAYLANGHRVQGEALWSEVPNAQGELAARVFWYGYIGDKQRAQWMQQAAGQR